MQQKKRPLPHKETAAGNTPGFDLLTAAAGRTAGARLHAGQYESLSIHKIDRGVHEHIARLLFEEHLQTILLKRCVAHLGGFGYVHSQRRASAAGDNEYPDPVAVRSLLRDHILEPLDRAVRKTYHPDL